MAEFDQDKFEDALDRFYRKLDALHGSVGRGSSVPGGKTKTGPVPRSAGNDDKRALAEHKKLLEQANARIKAGLKLSDAQQDAIDKETEATKDSTKSQKDLNKETDYTTKSFKNFGKSIFMGTGDLQSAFSNLGDSLDYSKNGFVKMLGGVAAGVGYALGALGEFAKNAADMGQFADLSKFSVGSVTQMKLMSGLGGSFIKIIEESQGRFRAFGSNSQEAAENLSNLSRGLKYGSAYLNSTLTKSLGKDLVKSVDAASTAAAAMGLTDEERAKLIGQIAQTSSLGAKNEQDAQKRLVQQYSETVSNTRKLSDAFGVSSKAILDAMAEFRKTSAGQFAGLEGNTAAQNLVPLIKQMGIANDPETVSRIALAMSRGQLGEAQYALGADKGSQQQILQMMAQAMQGTNNGQDVDALNRNLKGMTGQMSEYSKDLSRYASTNAEYAAPGAQLGVFAKNLEQGGKDTGKPTPSTSESDNIKSMNNLTAALESLRNVIIGLTAGVTGLLGTFGAILAFGAGGGLMKGGFGAIKDLLASRASANQGPQLPGAEKVGVFERLFGKADKASEDSKKGSIFERLFGGSSADKTADKAGGALDKVTDKVKSMGQIIADVGKGIGSFLKSIGKGLGGAIQGIMTGIAKGIEAFGNPAVLKGALILSASIAIIGAGLAAAIWLIGKSLPTFAEGLKSLTEVDGDALLSIGAGLAAIGAGAVIFAAGMIVGTSSSIVTGLMSLFGAKSPLEKVKEFVPIADKISMIGTGIKNFGEGIGLINSNVKNFDFEALAKFKDALISISDLKVPNLNGLQIPSIPTNTLGTLTQGDNTGGISDALKNTAITPEVIGQVLAYLQSIENDLQAIRGNTRGSNFEAPVRLA